MLNILVAFVAFHVLKQWNSMFGPQPAIHYLDDSCPSTNPHHPYRYTPTCTIYNSFPSLNQTLDDDSLGSILQLCYVAMAKARNPGCTTHNHTSGPVTCNLGHITESKSCAFFIQCHHLMMHVPVSGNRCHKTMTGYGITDKLYNPSCQFNHINTDTYEMTENCCSKSITVPVYTLLCHWSSQIDQKLHKNYKGTAQPLFLAINHSIYYLLNGTFNQAHDVKHLIDRLLLTFQKYITRHNDFKLHWFNLLLSGLLRSQHISLWFVIITFSRISIIARKLFNF